MAKSGRKPSITLTPELEDEICLALSTSPYMLEELCEENPHWPTAKYIYEKRILDASFGERFTRAKQSQIEALVSRIFILSRNKKGEYLQDDKGNHHPDGVCMNNKRLEIDSIKWLAGKLAPRIYGDTNKTANANDGEDFISKNRDKL